MSVIPLKRTGEKPTLVCRAQDFDNKGSAARIYPFDEKQPYEGDSNVSYDLRIGAEYWDHRDNSKTGLKEGDTIELIPGTAVLIETLESVSLPQTMFGYVVPRVTLLQDGISNTLSKVDPGYNAHLIVTVFNLGQKKVPLEYGKRFCSLVLHTVDQGAELYEKGAKQIAGAAKKRRLRRLRDSIQANAGMWAAAAVLIVVLREGLVPLVRYVVGLFR